MSVASQGVWDPRRWASRCSSVALLVLLGACGGERRDSATAGSEGAAVTDTAAAPAADTVAATDTGARDTSARDTAATGGTRDTAAKQVARKPAPAAQKPTPKPAPAATPKPAAPKDRPDTPTPDTAATAPDTDTSATANPTAAQDTAAAAADTPATAQADTGGGQTQTADAPLRDAYHQAPKDTVDQTTYDGWKQYNLNCARCHGEDVLGSTIAPHLVMSLKPDGPINTQEAFIEVVCAGRPAKGMPSWCALGMEPAKITQIYSYVKGRSDGKIGPGRPAVKPEG
jgi:hypothetical protein